MTVHEDIVNVASRRNNILRDLAATEDADGAFAEAEGFRQKQDELLHAANEQVALLEARHAKKQEKHQSLTESTKRRAMYRLVGKRGDFDEKTAERERVMFDAAQVCAFHPFNAIPVLMCIVLVLFISGPC